MPLRDHFRPPIDDVRSWDELHGGWPAMMVWELNKNLPEPCFGAPLVHRGSLDEFNIAATAPTRAQEPRLPHQDIYEVRIYDNRRNRRLVAVIEIVSPSNKNRPETRMSFVSKAATLLKDGVCVSIVAVVSTLDFNLYAELMDFLESTDPALGEYPPPMYAVTLRTRFEGQRRLMDNWYYPLPLGEPLPSLPIWLNETYAVSLDLEASYEETCRTLRIR